MARIVTRVPIDTKGGCPDPDAIISEVRALDVIVYELVPAAPDDDIGDWMFALYLRTKGDGASLPLTLALPGGPRMTAVVLPALPIGRHAIDLKIRNTTTGEALIIDPTIVRRK